MVKQDMFLKMKSMQISKQITTLINHNKDFRTELISLLKKYGVKL